MHPGLTLPSRKHLPDMRIEVLPAPASVSLLLDQHASVQLSPCVQVGEHVLRGQPIAKSMQPLGAWLHASVAGQVECIDAPLTNSSGAPATAIVIHNDGSDADHVGPAWPGEQLSWREVSALDLCIRLAQGGIVGLGGAAFPAATKLASHAMRRIDCLLINGAECEPYISCDDALMRAHAADILRGIQILLHACDAPRAVIAIENNKPQASAAMQAALRELDDDRIAVQVIPTAYPNGDEGQLISRLLNLEIPRDCLPADIGVIVQNVATAHACARWLLYDEPLISRIVTVTGLGIAQARNVAVRIGTECSALIAACGGYRDAAALIMGGAMMGKALAGDAVPITKASNCLIAATASELPVASLQQPCIRCGDCMHACPVNLMPQQLWWQLRSGNDAGLTQLGLRDCIECGCCDYVCPSHIALTSHFRAAKHREST